MTRIDRIIAAVLATHIGLLCAVAMVRNVRAEEPSPPAVGVQFDNQIAPLLASRCLECHNPSDRKGGLDLTSAETVAAGGESGKSIEPGKPDDSFLWSRIAADEMPPKHPLAPEERQLIRAWIEAGAAWGSGPIDRFRYTSEQRAGYDWWSLQPLKQPTPPTASSDTWSRNPIDGFVLESLNKRELQPSPEADRRTLIRRLTFDLTGLPPTPDEVAAFLADDQPGAYERIVERLLASPQYGVRWARHWLDIVRFGESNGFEYDEYRPNAWPYRDWVVTALNDDLPYDEFVRLQLAGDVLRPTELDATIATGFLAAGAYDTAGQGQQSLAMRAVVRQDEMEDLVGTVAQTFMGLTVNCARCHDHKFDPIRQSEYYALVAALSGTRQRNVDVARLQPGGKRNQEIESVKAQQQKILDDLKAIETPIIEECLADAPKPADLKPIASWDFTAGAEGQTPDWQVALNGSAQLTSEGLVLNDDTAFAVTPELSRDLGAKTLEAWVKLKDLQQRGGAVMSVEMFDGSIFDAIVFGEKDPRQWMSGSDNFARTQSFEGEVESEADQAIVHICVTYADDGTMTAYRNGRPYGKSYRANNTATFPAGQAHLVFGLRHSPAGRGKMLRGTIVRARLYDRALSADEIATSSGLVVTPAMIRARLEPVVQQRYDQLQTQSQHLAATLRALHPAQLYAIKSEQPQPTHLLARGNPAQPQEIIAPRGIASLGELPADFALAANAPEADRRRRLAEWVTDPRNPLFPRVMANRLWHYHFGVGLIDTPNDFGFNGGRPANQPLLDWLAAELQAHGYRLKDIHRLIVTSATYRQSSRVNSVAMKLDADNRLLWRKSPQRLEAEAVRDSMLSVAGVLDLSLGGPGFQEMKMTIAPGTNTFLYAADDPTREAFKRRTLYRVWARSGRSPLLDVLDCPDPSTTSPKRAVTTTPLQALSLLNNAFVLHLVDLFAERVTREAGADPAQQIERAYQLAYGRPPTSEEQAFAAAIVKEHGLRVLTRSLFNSNEFVYVD